MTVPTIFEGISAQPEATEVIGLFVAAESQDPNDPTNKVSLSRLLDKSSEVFSYDGLIYKGVGNISDFAGQQLQEAEKTNAYQYPDNSRQFYVADKSQAFPITIPTDPSSDNGWALVNALTSNSLPIYTDIVYKTVSDMIVSNFASSIDDGSIIKTARYNTDIVQFWMKVSSQPADFSGGYFVQGASAWFVMIQPGSNEIFAEHTGLNPLGNHANNKIAIETALLVAKEQGLGTVSFRDYASPKALVMCGSGIQLHRGIKLKMHGGDSGGAFLGGLVGDGNAPIFLTGTYTPGGSNTPSPIREITFENLSAANTNGHPVAEIYSPNFKAIQGRYKTQDSETLKFRYAFRATIRGGRHESTWTTFNEDNFTITAYDNVNGLLITPDTILSGGTNGGGVDVTQSQKVNIDFIGESMGNFGIRVAGYDGLEAGNCNAVHIAAYLEKCPNSVSIGARNRVTGLVFGELWINQSALSSAPDYAILLGKVNGVTGGQGIVITGHGTEPAIMFAKGAAGSGTLGPNDVYLEGVNVSNVASNYAIDPTLLNGEVAAAFNSGRVKIGDGRLTGNIREYLSDKIEANVGTPSSYRFIDPTDTSGFIDKVEILEVSGSLTGAVLAIGDTINLSRNFNYDLGLSSPSNGYDDLSNEVLVDNLRTAEPTLFRVAAGSGAGTFRFKITYRS